MIKWLKRFFKKNRKFCYIFRVAGEDLNGDLIEFGKDGKLYKANRRSSKMNTHHIKSLDKDVSDETIGEACKEYFKTYPEKYIFKPGDVVKNTRDSGVNKRLIIKDKNTKALVSVDLNSFETLSAGQADFEYFGYKKIGGLRDILK